jgi:hypothetical protein
MSKYEPLKDFLRNSKLETVRLNFAEVEQILGFHLPQSAYRYPAWWSNNPEGHSHSVAWVNEGWQSEQVDVQGRQVTFRRKHGTASSRSVKPSSGRTASPFGALRGTVRFAANFDPTEPTGEIWEAEQGRL